MDLVGGITGDEALLKALDAVSAVTHLPFKCLHGLHAHIACDLPSILPPAGKALLSTASLVSSYSGSALINILKNVVWFSSDALLHR